MGELQFITLIDELQKLRLGINVVEAPQFVLACFEHDYKKLIVKLEHYSGRSDHA